MARPLRIEYPNAWYHVMNRGRRGEEIFTEKKDYEVFLAVLKESAELFGIQVAAYCLMSNHYHLLIQTPDGNLSRAMRHINGVYTQRFNRRRKVDGQLFRGRYKSVLVEADSHLLELLRYIHRNPVRTEMCETVYEYPWSSHAGYLSRAKKWDWLFRQQLLGMFSERPVAAKTEYRKFVQESDSERIVDFFEKKTLPSILGSRKFVQWVKHNYFKHKKHDEMPQSIQLAPTIAEIKEAVMRVFKVAEKDLLKTSRGQVNEARNLAIYLARKLSRQRLKDISKEFGLGSYSSVSSVVVRTELLLSQNKILRNKLERIKKDLGKGQPKT